MRYYFDTEFIEDGKTIDPISIGIVAEDGRELYLQNTGCAFSRASDWVGRNVFPHLDHFDVVKMEPTFSVESPYPPNPWMHRGAWSARIEAFLGDDPAPEFWAYYADYDWVLFCQLWGKMIDLPDHFPRFCRDLQQEIVRLRREGKRVNIPPQIGTKHNALEDARWVASTYAVLLKPAVEITPTPEWWNH